MIILHGMVLIIKVGFAVGCVVGGLMIFPTWYGVCETVTTMLADAIWYEEPISASITMFLNFFPYLSIFLISLAVYIGFIKLLDSMSGSSSGGLD